MSKSKGTPRPPPKAVTRTRSAVDGRFKTDSYGTRNPNITVRERVPLPGYGENAKK
jgi:hypothetical protein